jgi:hypothetical protein
VLQVASLAAVGAGHDDVFLQVQRTPTWRDPFNSRTKVAAVQALHNYRVLDHDVVNSFPKWDGNKWLYPRSHLLKNELHQVLLPLVGDDDSYTQLYSRTEYRIALVQYLFSDEHGWACRVNGVSGVVG